MDRELTAQQKLWLWGSIWLRAIKPLALYILMPAVCMSLGYVILHPDMTAKEFFTYGGNFYTAVGMVLTLVLLGRSSRKKGSSFFEDATLYVKNMERWQTVRFFCFGVASAVTVSAVLTLLPRWGVVNAYSDASQNMYRGPDILFTVLTMVITAPLAEEIVFRGYMLNTLLEQFDEKTAVWQVSLVFALCHGDMLWMIYALVMGLVLAWVSMKEDNIGYSIAMHIGFNFPSVITWLLRTSPEAEQLFYGNNLLIFAYGLVSFLTAVLLARTYLDDRRQRG